MASILILFGSTGGNTELVCDEVSHILKAKKNNVTMQRAENSSPDDIRKYDLCILASSTYGQGLLQDHMRAFIKSCSSKHIKNTTFAVIGLGDNKYNTEYVIEAANILEKKVKENNGTLLSPTLRINKTPVPHLKTRVEKWANDIAKQLK
jgi:flavodoxin I